MDVKLSEHFSLSEFVPAGLPVPPEIEVNIRELVATILEPLRAGLGARIFVHDGWRPAAHNAHVGGVPASDHLTGRAADFHADGDANRLWEERTMEAFDWVRINLDGHFGQLIMEDHRAFTGQPGKVWVHVALPGKRHQGGRDDPNRLLMSHAPHAYSPWVDGRFAP